MKAIFENKELKIICFKTDSMRTYEPMYHSHGEILYVLEGTVSVTVNGTKKEVMADGMCMVFPYAIHSYEPSKDAKVIVVLFSVESTGEFSDILLSKVLCNPFFESCAEYLMCLKKILSLVNTEDILKQKTAGAYLKSLIGEILLDSDMEDAKASNPDAVRAVLSYCIEHFDDDITIKDISEHVFVSERYVTKVFSEKVGCSFRKYINNLRISKAKNLMKNGKMRITDIMYECGFKNQSSFNRIFLDETGTTPRKYRKIHK